jgi:hypothetical protein
VGETSAHGKWEYAVPGYKWPFLLVSEPRITESGASFPPLQFRQNKLCVSLIYEARLLNFTVPSYKHLYNFNNNNKITNSRLNMQSCLQSSLSYIFSKTNTVNRHHNICFQRRKGHYTTVVVTKSITEESSCSNYLGRNISCATDQNAGHKIFWYQECRHRQTDH